MEAIFMVPQSTSPFSGKGHRRSKRLPPNSPTVVAVFTRPVDINISVTPTDIERTVAENSTIYKDNWFDRIAINHISKSLQASTGLRNEKSGYASFVEAAAATYRNFNPSQQEELVANALYRAFPRPIMSLIRRILPQSRFAREFFAVFTTLFFAWLVGPCEVRESEDNGVTERNVVHINKCRFLEETKCVGMCVNLCKMPSQAFIRDSLGTPVNMVPNFDDMSCEMVFGQNPPATTEDPALKQPCYKLCRAIKKHSKDCLG